MKKARIELSEIKYQFAIKDMHNARIEGECLVYDTNDD